MHNPNEVTATARMNLKPSEHKKVVEGVLSRQLEYWMAQHEKQKCSYCRVEEIKAAIYSLSHI